MALKVDELKKSVLHYGIDLLSRREHSAKELATKMRAKSFESEDIEPVLQYLKQHDYLSELRFTECIYRSRINKGYGQRYIEQELRQKGVSSDLILQVEQELTTDWYDVALLAYQKKFGHKEWQNDKEKAKRIRFLQYRGFSTDEIFTALNKT